MFVQFLTAVVLYANVIFALPVVKRSVDLNNPCYVLAESNPSPSNAIPLSESMQDLISRTEGLKLEAEGIKAYLIDHREIDNKTVQKLNAYNWMDEEEFDATVEQIQAALEQKYEALTSHYHLLAEHLLYINQARTVGQIAEIDAEVETRSKLESYENALKSTMCSVKIALLSSGNDATSMVTESDLDSLFLLLKDTLVNATHRAYIALQDGTELMNFLNVIYKEIQSLDDTEA